METGDQAPDLYSAAALHAISSWLLKLHDLSTASEPDAFPEKAMEKLKAFIPHQASFWGGGRLGPGELPVWHYIYLNDLNPATLVAREAHKKEVSGELKVVAENAGRAFSFSAARTPDNPIFTLVLGPEGISEILTICLSDESRGLYHAISLYRKDGTAFSEGEKGILEAVAPHLVRALRNGQIARIARLTKPPQENLSASAIVDVEGILHFAEDRLIASLRTEWPDWRGPWLPRDAWEKLSGGDGAGQFTGKRIVLSLENSGNLPLISVRPKFAIDELSAREREVARLFASGLKYKEIAQHLNIAPSTVRCQLNTVYVKLGINDKAALAEYLRRF